jgi:Ca2+-binding RTX toxin-like protein
MAMADITGTPDDDALVGTSGDDNISALAGNDLVNGLEGADTIDGGDGHDILNGQQGNDTVYGGNGDDLIRPGTGDDYADGGAGFDRVSYASVGTDNLASGVTVSLALQGTWQNTGGGGVDFLVGFENLTGTRFDDNLTGDSTNNWLWGGFDPTTGFGGNDVYSAGGGNDLVELSLGSSSADGGSGTDAVTFFGDDVGVASGVTFSLALQGTTQSTSFGNVAATGFENLSGTIFSDSLSGDGGDNVLAGDQGDDTLAGGAGNDTLYGDGRIFVDDHGTGYSGAITTFTDVGTSFGVADGNDTIEGGLGDDYLDGAAGSDTASYAHASGAVEVALDPFGGFADGADGVDTLVNIENAIGSAYDDTLLGDDGNNVLTGGDGHDFLYGYGGDDALHGGNGDDFLRGYEGNDILDGGSGWDRASFYEGTESSTGVTVDLNILGPQDTGHGVDTLIGIEHISGTTADDTLIGDGGNNWIWDGSDGAAGGGTGNDTMSGGAGNDLIETGGGNDVLDGGTGLDTWSFLGGNVEISSAGVTASLVLQGAAQATEQGSVTATGFENLSGSIYDDNLSGDGGDNVIAGDQGNDTLIGGAGSDFLYGDGRIAADTHGLGGSGPITQFSDVTAIDPTLADGNDTLDGGAGDDMLYGGGGVDTASFASWTEAETVGIGTGGNGSASNDAGTENDFLFSIENITGSAYNDFINGNSDANVLTGGDGGDALFGRGGDDTMIGGNGSDFLRGSDGADILDGGAGWDRVSSFVATPTGGIHFDLNIQGVAQDTGQGMDTLIGIEHASGTTLNDTLIGNGGDNWLWDGSDGVAGGSTGDDVLTGNAGNDLIETGGGNDTLSGGTGIDTLSFLGGHVEITSAGVTYSLALQGAAQTTEQGSMITSGFENVSGSLYDDVLAGDGNANILLGDFGNDALSGGSGNDTLYGDGRIWVDTADSAGGSGPIALFGTADDGEGLAAGNDSLNGGNGNDTLYGGRGNDTLTGGAGDDRFVIEAASGADHITDFSNHDTIVFDPGSGVDSFSDLTLTKVGNSTVISWGTGDSLTIDGVKPNQLHASDFTFAAPASPFHALDASATVEVAGHQFPFDLGIPHLILDNLI